MDIVFLIARIAFAALFVSSGVNHFTASAEMAGYAAGKGLPAAKAAVLGSGVLLLAGGLSVLFGVWADLGALLLILFLLVATPLFHAFWKETDPTAKVNDQIHFFKNLALAGGGAFLHLLVVSAGDDLGLTVTGPLFHFT